MAAAYDRLDLPSWPPPRPEGVEPRVEEYSRVSDLHKYRVVHGRAGPTEHGDTVDSLHVAVQDTAHLLENIDDQILSVVAGPFVMLTASRWTATWHPDGGSMDGGTGTAWDFDDAMRACRRLADGRDVRLPGSCTALVGRSWWDAVH